MTDLTIDLPSFYKEMGRLLDAHFGCDRNYNECYGKRRQKDAYYATKIIGFEIIHVGDKSSTLCGHDAPVRYTHIYNRRGAKPDLQYLIAPDTRVPNYTTSLDDSTELAQAIGLKTLNIPTWPCQDAKQDYLDQVLSACDAVIGCEYREDT